MIKEYIETHNNRKQICIELYQQNLLEWLTKSDAILHSKQQYEYMLQELLDSNQSN